MNEQLRFYYDLIDLNLLTKQLIKIYDANTLSNTVYCLFGGNKT